MGLFTSTTWPWHHVTNLQIESVNPNSYFLLVLRLSSNGQAQTRNALYINVLFSNDIKLMSFLLASLTVLRKLQKYIKEIFLKISSWTTWPILISKSSPPELLGQFYHIYNQTFA